jgi:YVTN family beta-propeller protein
MKSLLRVSRIAMFMTALLFADRGFAESVVVGNFFAPTVSVVSEETNTVVHTITLPAGANGPGEVGGVAINPVTSRLYISDNQNSVIYVMNARNHRILATIPGLRGAITVNPRTNKIYVSSVLLDTVTIINGKTNQIAGTVAIPLPERAAFDFVTDRIYIPSGNFFGDVFVLDGKTDAVLAEIPTGIFTASVGIDFLHHRAYASNQGISPATSSVSVIDTVTNTVVATIATDPGPTPVSVNPFTNRIYVATAFNTPTVIDIIDGESLQIVERLPVEPNPSDSAIDVIHELLYVTSPNFQTGGGVVTIVRTRRD